MNLQVGIGDCIRRRIEGVAAWGHDLGSEICSKHPSYNNHILWDLHAVSRLVIRVGRGI